MHEGLRGIQFMTVSRLFRLEKKSREWLVNYGLPITYFEENDVNLEDFGSVVGAIRSIEDNVKYIAHALDVTYEPVKDKVETVDLEIKDVNRLVMSVTNFINNIDRYSKVKGRR